MTKPRQHNDQRRARATATSSLTREKTQPFFSGATSVAQPRLTLNARGLISTYRPQGSIYFGENDTSDLKEDSFNRKSQSDRDTKPWLKRINIKFDRKRGTGGDMFPVGSLEGIYHSNPAGSKLGTITASDVTGGSAKFGFTDDHKVFTVGRIEGPGYNDTAVADPIDRGHWRKKHYGKRDEFGDIPGASMEYAVFFNGGQALHAGSLTEGSHSCVHVDWGGTKRTMRQINHHSVSKLTKVHITYDKTNAAFKELCCERKKYTGGFRNPCNKGWDKKC